MSETSGAAAAGRVPFGQRLAAAMDEHGPLCVGIDPHPGLLRDWGLPDDVIGLGQFATTVLQATGPHVAAVKPQAALFERHGSKGVLVLETIIEMARDLGVLSIVDAKRGDIGSTMQGYADAYLRDGSALAGDAVTLSPYLGFGSLDPAIEAARDSGRGVFVLCLTSNPEGASVQHAVDDAGLSVAAGIARSAGEVNRIATGNESDTSWGPVGLVVGATIGDAARENGVDLAAVRGPLLAPGVGAQGAGAAELAQVFGSARHAVLASSSRGVLKAGPDIVALRQAAIVASREAAQALGRA
ncbi:orotidine-5'-phosphate decarboxylase [Micrococcales bacterium KH10]|nr:orotidine-5'-phosphate decarboxylase [Micrococcales bacterium KH10]